MSELSILVIDDETAVLKSISAVLKREDMNVTCADNGALALEILKNNTFDLILLDVMMPEQNGFELLAEIRKKENYTPVLLLSGREEDAAQVRGLQLGADDYMTKPFSKDVLVSKIRAIVRRNSQYKDTTSVLQPTVQKGVFTLHMDTQTVSKGNQEISLTTKEFALLCLFIDNPEHVFTKQEIYHNIWKSDNCDDNTILVYIKKLRNKIEDDPSTPKHICTIWGKGYQYLP